MLETMIFPIGRYAGAIGGSAHQVCHNGHVERLDPSAFAVWGLAHGPIDPVLAAGVPWTRAELERYAVLAGLPEPADLVGWLMERGLLVETPVDGTKSVAFARTHRVVPLAIGFGNSAAEPDRFTIGHLDHGVVQVTELAYQVWCWSAVHENLWQACQDHAGQSDQADAPEVLNHFLTAAHPMLSASVLYLDVVAA